MNMARGRGRGIYNSIIVRVALRSAPAFLLGTLFLFPSFVLHTYAQSSLDSLKRAITSGTVEEKREALRQIRNLRSEEGSRLAVPALSAGSDMVRATAAASVVFLPKAEAADQLVRMLKDKSSFVRKEAAYAIGEVGDAKTMLGEGKEDAIAAALRQVLQNDKDPEVRSAAAIAMGTAGGLQSVWYLYFFLQETRDKPNEFLRRSAIKSIGNVAAELRSGKRVIPSLRLGIDPNVIKWQDLTQEYRVFKAAARMLVDILQNQSEEDDVRRESATALGAIGALEAIPALNSNLNAKDPYLAKACSEAIEKLKLVKPS
jgi:HEAT repeat protein